MELRMATILYRLGRFSYRRRGSVVLAWLLLLALAVIGTATLAGTTSNTFSIPGTESQRAAELLAERFGQTAGDRASARIVFTTTGSGAITDPARAAAIGQVTTTLQKQPKVLAVQDAVAARQISPDLHTAFTTVTYSVPGTDLTESDRTALATIGRSAASAGMGVEFGGTAFQEGPGQSPAEGIGVVVA